MIQNTQSDTCLRPAKKLENAGGPHPTKISENFLKSFGHLDEANAFLEFLLPKLESVHVISASDLREAWDIGRSYESARHKDDERLRRSIRAMIAELEAASAHATTRFDLPHETAAILRKALNPEAA